MGELMKALGLARVLGGTLALSATLAHGTLARAEDMAELVSKYRQQHGLSAVKFDPELTKVAERQAKAMADSGIMDHSVAGSFASRISGVHTGMAAENIAAGTKTWSDTLRMWENSPGHNANLLQSHADTIRPYYQEEGRPCRRRHPRRRRSSLQLGRHLFEPRLQRGEELRLQISVLTTFLTSS
jgi:uncharacterized protein YkwD